MSEQNNFKLRKAIQSDIKNIYELSNEENVRENSTNSKPIDWGKSCKMVSGQIG